MNLSVYSEMIRGKTAKLTINQLIYIQEGNTLRSFLKSNRPLKKDVTAKSERRGGR